MQAKNLDVNTGEKVYVATVRYLGVLENCCYTVATLLEIWRYLDREGAALIILLCVGVCACWLDDQPEDIGDKFQWAHALLNSDRTNKAKITTYRY
jgi:hypothetical protein